MTVLLMTARRITHDARTHDGVAYDSAEQETKAKLEKVAEIKRINAQMMAVKSEISKYEDTLKEYQLYKKFLEALTPKVSFAWNIHKLVL